MKYKSLWIVASVAAMAAVAGASEAQIVPNSVPAGYTVPTLWSESPPLFPQPQQYYARVFWTYELRGGMYTYWYRIDHMGAGPFSGNPAVIQNIKSATLNVDPLLLKKVGNVYQFGQMDAPYDLPGQSWAAESVLPGDSTIRWSWQNNPAYNQLQPHECEIMWLQSPYGPVNMNLSLQDGIAANAQVCGPGVPPVPEPASMALAAVGLTVVGGLRRRRRRQGRPF